MSDMSPTAPTAAPTLAIVGHDRFVADVQAIGAMVAERGWRPGYVVGIGRGGLAPGVYLSHRLDVPLLSVDHSSRVFGFADALLMNLAKRSAGGERLLFIDDINDSGSTIAYLRDALASNGADMENVRFAVLIDNVRSTSRVDYASRSIDRAENKDWFVFPWEEMARSETLIEEAQAVPERLA